MSQPTYKEFGHFGNRGTDKAYCKRNLFFKNRTEFNKLIKEYGETDVSISCWQYKEPYGAEVKGDWFLDFDHDENLDAALYDTQRAVEIINKSFKLTNQIRVFFSGAKGFHLVVPNTVMQIDWDEQTPYIYKKMAQELGKGLPNKTIDYQIYESRRIMRVVNTINSTYGLYKIPLSERELFTFTVEEIKEAAKEKRNVKYEKAMPSPDFRKKFEIFKKYLETSNRKQNANMAQISDKDFRLTPCIATMLKEGVGKGNRNEAVYGMARYFKNTNKSEDQTVNYLMNYYCEAHELGELEIRSAVKSAYASQHFIGCHSNKLFKSRCMRSCYLMTREVKVENLSVTENEQNFSTWDIACWNRGELLGFRTGWDNLTKKIDGWQKTKFYVITAATNVGKTDWLCNIANNVLNEDEGAKVTYVTLDDDAETIFTRIVAIRSKLTKNQVQNPIHKIQNNEKIPQRTKERFMQARKIAVEEVRKYISTGYLKVLTGEDIKCAKDVEDRLQDSDFVLVDGFHNLTPNPEKGHSYMQTRDIITQATKDIKALIKKNKVVGIITAEARKTNKGADETYVGINDLAESRSLMYEPDMIMCINPRRSDEATVDDRQIDLDVTIPKNKTSGFKGTIRFVLDRFSGHLTENTIPEQSTRSLSPEMEARKKQEENKKRLDYFTSNTGFSSYATKKKAKSDDKEIEDAFSGQIDMETGEILEQNSFL